jgi:hypothetical protein
MVSPDLRRDMAGIPEISGSQERERNVEHNTQRKCLHHRGFRVLNGEPSSWDESKLQPSTRFFEEKRERDHSSVCKEDSLRESGP